MSEEEVEPGERHTFTVRVLNQTRRGFSFETSLQDMEAAPASDGGRRFLEPGESDWGAASWMSVAPATWTLGPATTQELTVTVDVPADAGGGGRYAALLIRAQPVENPGNLQLTSEISVFALLKVGGKQRRNLDVDVEAPGSPRWRGGRATWKVRIRNRGDVHENISGRLRIDGVLGSHEPRGLEPFILLPGGERIQRFTFDLRDAPDLWTASARVDTGDDELTTTSAPRVLVLPWWLLMLLTIAVAIIAWRVRSRRQGGQEHDHDDGFDEAEFR